MHPVYRSSTALLLMWCVPVGGAAQPEPIRLNTLDRIWHEKSVPIGLRKQLVVDDWAISQKHNISREFGRATRGNEGKPVLEPTEPWENIYFGCWLTVLHDGKKFQMWYCAFNYCMAYAESTDGLKWTRPDLSLYDFDPAKVKFDDELGRPGGGFIPYPGRAAVAVGKKNNLIGDFGHQFTLFRDANAKDENHRYKAICSHVNPRQKSAACLWHSPDGLRNWRPYNDGEPVTGRASDTLNQVLWDEQAKVYRLYTREDFGTPGGLTEYRGTRHMTNPDIQGNPTAWELVRKWELDREGPVERRRRQVMSFTNWIYEGVHFGFLQCHEYPAGVAGLNIAPKNPKRPERDVNNLYVCPCRDGNSWDLTAVYAEKRLLERGAEGSFDMGYLAPAPTPVTWNDQHWIFYGGWPVTNSTIPERMGIGVARLRLDGFLYLQPWIEDEPGWIITKPFKLGGKKLEINADARRGSLTVEVLDADTAEPLAGLTRAQCRPVTADGVCLPVHWQEAVLGAVHGRNIRLKFHLHRAKLYAFQIKE